MYKNKKYSRGKNFSRFRNKRGRRGFGARKKIPNYNPMMFVRKATDETVELYSSVNKFSDFSLNPALLKNIELKGYSTPTAIQDQAIRPLLDGRDVVGVADTGTGKTAAFLLPLIQKMLVDNKERVLIVLPTRELAVQVESEFRDLSKNTYLRSAVCIGGIGIGSQINKLQKNPNLIVGTPGRLLDLEERRKINFSVFKTIVLDEVDRMLDMGFVKDVSKIVSKLSTPRQSLFFSATLPNEAQKILRTFTHNPVFLTIKTQAVANNIDQDIVRLNGREKLQVLNELLHGREFEKVLVFGRTKRGIDKIAKNLVQKRVTVAVIHGNKSQSQRQRALDQFKNNKVKVLLATDIASRGLDISDVTHVVNYDLPESYEDYIHRIGRTGRANKKGKALTFVD